MTKIDVHINATVLVSGPTGSTGPVKCDDANDPACKEKRKSDGIDEDVAAKKSDQHDNTQAEAQSTAASDTAVAAPGGAAVFKKYWAFNAQ